MNKRILDIIYYAAIMLLLIFASIEAYKEGKKVVSFLSALIAVISGWYIVHHIRKPYSG